MISTLLATGQSLTVAPPAATTAATVVAWRIIGLPLIGAALLLIGGRLLDSWGHWLAVVLSFASFACGLTLFIQMVGRSAADRAQTASFYTWMSLPGIQTDLSLRLDPLSIVFVLLITGVGSLIHLYSVGYMAHDEKRRKFFAYLNLFMAAMLLLVLGNSYLVLFVGWEGVGLASYLLIGFWAHRPAAANAANKAFIMNRMGDVGMMLAIVTMFKYFGSTEFSTVNAHINGVDSWIPTFLGFMLLLGACAKSAQVPFQAWLLDAMEGPTPVSALIHAATMVTAGVYLVVRSGSIYQRSSSAALAVVIIGTITLLVGAWIGSSKDDIKKILAGSTMSQIGYMILAAGIGPAGYALAIFHLVTHGFFKANMFLGAGSIMHAMDDSTDMRRFGGLRKAMPWTFFTFAAGYLAIIGFPGFAGFFSKDPIIEVAFDRGWVFGLAALIGAGVTAFYMTRLMMMTFFGEKRWEKGVDPHEAPVTMVIPLVILGIFSVIGGFLLVNSMGDWLNPAVGGTAELSMGHFSWDSAVTLIVVIIGVLIGWLVFRKPIPTTRENAPLYTRIGDNAFYGDTINEYIAVKPTNGLSQTAAFLDRRAINPAVDGGGRGLISLSGVLSRLQNGLIRSYGLLMVVGAAVLAAVALILGQLA